MPEQTTDAPSVTQALATMRGEAVEPELDLTPAGVPAPAPALDEPVAAEDLGPYVARLIAEARQAADEFRRDTEREVAERAAAVIAKATSDAEALRAQATRDGEATVAAARTRVEMLVTRVEGMAEELRTEARALLAPGTEASEPAP